MSNDLPEDRDQSDEGARFLERIVAEYRMPLTRYAVRLLGDADRARDVVQDTFLRFMARPAAEIDGHVVEWLFTVCRNRSMDIMRKESRMTPLSDASAERIAAADPSPGERLEASEARRMALGLIMRLPPNQQEVVRLKFQNGFSYKEIARITELSVSNVGFLIHTAVASLRREWAARASNEGAPAP
jgi:RNA polymerase sigma-70 factor (ECF subfamily)